MVFTYSTREVTNISLMSRWEMEGSLDRSRDYKMMMQPLTVGRKKTFQRPKHKFGMFH